MWSLMSYLFKIICKQQLQKMINIITQLRSLYLNLVVSVHVKIGIHVTSEWTSDSGRLRVEYKMVQLPVSDIQTFKIVRRCSWKLSFDVEYYPIIISCAKCQVEFGATQRMEKFIGQWNCFQCNASTWLKILICENVVLVFQIIDNLNVTSHATKWI